MNWETVRISVGGTSWTLWQAGTLLGGACLGSLLVIAVVGLVAFVAARRGRGE